MQARLEHVNISVSDPEATAETLCALFGWQIRWRGPAMNGGRSVHVGTETDYIAVYAPAGGGPRRFEKSQPLNHVGVVVGDLDDVEMRVRDAGLTPFAHSDYAPGRRFYFMDRDNIEWEVVSYA